MAYKINFSIPEDDKMVYEKLTSMSRNKSRYICDLIKKDMGLIKDTTTHSGPIDEKRINELIENKIKELMDNTDKENAVDLNDIKVAINVNSSEEDFM